MASSVSAEVLRIAELDTEQIRALVEGNAAFRTNTGETFDFLWAPCEPGEATLSFGFENLFEPGELILRQALRVV